MAKKNFIGSLFILVSGAIAAQELQLEELYPNFKDQAVVINIIARVVEPNHHEVWNQSNSKVTIPGHPVGLKLMGTNIIVAVQFTPYLKGEGKSALVVQSQIWVDIPQEGIRYFTSLRTIPLNFGEEVLYFPLGQGPQNTGTSIEISLALNPYQEAGHPDTSSEQINNSE